MVFLKVAEEIKNIAIITIEDKELEKFTWSIQKFKDNVLGEALYTYEKYEFNSQTEAFSNAEIFMENLIDTIKTMSN